MRTIQEGFRSTGEQFIAIRLDTVDSHHPTTKMSGTVGTVTKAKHYLDWNALATREPDLVLCMVCIASGTRKTASSRRIHQQALCQVKVSRTRHCYYTLHWEFSILSPRFVGTCHPRASARAGKQCRRIGRPCQLWPFNRRKPPSRKPEVTPR